jgi:hypothetical protein
VYITGIANSTDFPTAFSLMPPLGGSSAFVARLRGSSFDFSSFLGGSGSDFGTSVVAAPTGEVYVSGWTNSTDFPTVSPYRATRQGNSDVFVSQILFEPSVPRSIGVTSGDGQLTITFTPPATNGGSSITGYTVTCNPGNIVVSGTTSPIVVTGLTNGTQYTCNVAATNGVGTNSTLTFGTPSAPVVLQNVTSRRDQGVSGNNPLFIDSNQPIDGPITIEPRLGAQSVRFTFAGPLYAPVFVSVQDAQNNFYGSSTSLTSNSVTLGFTVPNGKRVKVSLFNVNNTGATMSASFAALAGDVNGSRGVTASDILIAKGQVGQPVLGINTQDDVDNSGDLTAADVDAVKAKSGTEPQ